MIKNTLKEITHELDHNYSSLNILLNTLDNARTELGIVAEKVHNANKKDMTSLAITMHDISHKIELLDALMIYAVKDMKKELNKTNAIKESYFDLLVREVEPAELRNKVYQVK